MFYGNLVQLGKKSNSVIMSRSVMVKNWCNVLSLEGVSGTSMYRYIDDVLSINNPEFENYLGQMYPAELEIKDTTESTTSASYLDLLLSIGRDGQLHTSIYDKRDDFNFHITNFPFLSSYFHLCRPTAYLCLNLCYTPGLAPGMNVLFWGSDDFPVSYSNWNTSWNA